VPVEVVSGEVEQHASLGTHGRREVQLLAGQLHGQYVVRLVRGDRVDQ